MKSPRASAKSKGKIAATEVAGVLRRPNHKSFPIVGIGASAGGLEAFTMLLGDLPRKSGMAFVFVQHLAPKHESALRELLSRATEIPVREVIDGMAVEPDHVYVIPPNANMGILDGHLHLMPRAPAQPHLPINFFLASLAAELGNKAIGVILSGTASDGSLGMKAIKAEGGITFAQDLKSAKYNDMPRNAIATGCIDFVLTPDAIARELIQIAHHPYLLQAPEVDESSDEGDNELRKVFALLRTATGIDFSNYKLTTIKRRIRRRMLLHKDQSLADYISHLQVSREELDALYQDILIHVTGFFRDPEVFQALQVEAFPNLLKNRPPGLPLRIWVPGCSTGEEVYSIAICLLEFLGDTVNSTDIQVFATDISEAALDKARAGVYPESITAEVSPERLRRFFLSTKQGYQINKAIRDICVFARQDISKDPPFSRLDLISCRNLLIYFGSALQKRVVPIFHYALKPTGYLLLGNSETIGSFSSYFSLLDKKHKIYAKRPVAGRVPVDLPQAEHFLETGRLGKKLLPVAGPFDVQKAVDRLLLARFAPAGVVVNEELEILQFRGRAGAFMDPAPGQASLSLPKMAHAGLAVDLRAGIQRARNENAPVQAQGVMTEADGKTIEVKFEVIPIQGASSTERYFLVLFEEESRAQAELAKSAKKAPGKGAYPVRPLQRHTARLQEELAQTKGTLQSIIEQQETTNEELKSANEEILSSNEELQSTNEELETAKEELQSTNEELTTLNEELQNRNLELSVANNDLLNFLASANIPMLMLGNDLRIRHFTPPAEKLLNLIRTDVGRPIGDLKPNFIFDNLEQSITETIDSMSGRELEVQDGHGSWYSMRVRPYKTAENKLDGAVITWIDISALKASLVGTEKALSKVEERYRLLFERNLAGVFRATLDGRFLEVNSAFAKILGYATPAEVKALKVHDLYCAEQDVHAFLAQFKNAEGPTNFEFRMCRKDGHAVWVLTNAALVRSEGEEEAEIEGIVLDLTARMEAEESLRRFPGQLIEMQDAERKRISRDLHDSTGASLTALVADLALVAKSASAMDKKARRALTESLTLAKHCSNEIRTLAYLLHPPLLDEQGLASALHWYANGFAERSGVKVELEVPADLGRLPQDLEITFFRIVQEALTNIHLHSGSATAGIRITRADSEVVLEVEDAGKGIPELSPRDGKDQGVKHRSGVGISGMRERVSQLEGRLEISSRKDGTTVKAVLPLHKPHGA
jgi:two-component system, chemotaxis family, CheB/CheR fusion protein